MKPFSLQNFELPAIFAKMNAWATRPPQTSQHGREDRRASEVLSHPLKGYYDPAALHHRDVTLPVVPGNGGYITMGLGPVVYDHQPQFHRDRADAGPVREFFNHVMFDNRVKHL